MPMPVTGLAVERSIKPARSIAMSDGMAALETRLAGAKQNKQMKNAKRPGASKGGFMKSFGSQGTSKPYSPEGPTAKISADSQDNKTPWNKTGKKSFGNNQTAPPKTKSRRSIWNLTGKSSFGGK